MISEALAPSLFGSGSEWLAALVLIEDQPPVSASGRTPSEALEAWRRAALAQVREVAAAQGLAVGPAELASVELRLRLAASVALRRQQSPAPRLRTPPDPLGFGVDVSTFPDLDRRLGMIVGPRVVAEAVARRWLTPRGTLAYAPTYGEDVRAYLSARVDAGRLAALVASLQSQALEDERVTSARVTVTYAGSGPGLQLQIRGELATAAGPFALTLSVDQLAARLEVLRT